MARPRVLAVVALLLVAFAAAALWYATRDLAEHGTESSARQDENTAADRVAPADAKRRLGALAKLSGEVRSATDRKPVAGASVVALRRTLSTDASTAPLCCRATSDAAGRYALDSLSGGEMCLWAARPGGRLMIVAALKPEHVPNLDLVLPEPTYLTGH